MEQFIYKVSQFHLKMFLVCAFSFKEKSPTITVASFFFLFFRQTTELIAYVPLFTETDKTTQAKSSQWKLSAKGPLFHFLLFLRILQNRKRPKDPPFQLLFRHCAKFFSKIFQCLKRVPPSSFLSFLIIYNRIYVNESQRSPFSFFGTIFEVFFQKKIFQKISIFLFLVGKK